MRPAVSSRSLPSVPKARQPSQMSMSDEGSIFRDSTPYRLPKIPLNPRQTHRPPRTAESVTRSAPTRLDHLYKVDYDGSGRMDAYLSKRRTLPSPPYTISQLHRQEGIHMPTFTKAHIEPVLPCNKVGEYTEDAELEQSTSRTSTSSRDMVILGLGNNVANTQESPSSADKHSTWRLSPHKHKNYDVQAIQGQIGPFSRDFVIHCNTPNSWLQMKLKKQRTSHR